MSKNQNTTATATTTDAVVEKTVPTATTMNLSIDVRDTLNDYRVEMGFRSLGDAIQYLLIEAGYEMPLPNLVAGLEWVDDSAASAA